MVYEIVAALAAKGFCGMNALSYSYTRKETLLGTVIDEDNDAPQLTMVRRILATVPGN